MSASPVKPLLPLMFLFVLQACSTSHLTLSVLKPALLTLPQTIRSVSVYPVPGLIHDNHGPGNIDEIQINDTADIYQIRIGYLHGIYDIFVNSPRFDRVIFSDSSYTGIPYHGQVFWDDLREVCRHDTTDVVLLLQKAVSQDQVMVFESEGRLLYYGAYKITNYSKWTFVQPFREITLATYVTSDSLMLDGMFGLKGDPEYNLYRAFYTSGILSGRKLCPYWFDTTRTYFARPGKDMKVAAALVEKNRWYNATRIWNEIIEEGSNKMASRAAYNTALAFEHDDDLEQASLWIEYADSLHSTKHTVAYRNILRSRQGVKSELEKQLAGR